MKAQQESFEVTLPELIPLLRENWEKLNHNELFDPNYLGYVDCERVGILKLLTVRDGAQLVGYWIEFQLPSLQVQRKLRATLDTWGIKKGYEKTAAALILMRAVESLHVANGISKAFVGSRINADCGRLYEAFGYQPVEKMYVMSYGDR